MFRILMLCALNLVYADIYGVVVNGSGIPMDSAKVIFPLQNKEVYTNYRGNFTVLVDEDQIVSLEELRNEKKSFEVFTLEGRRVAGNASVEDLESLPWGIYFLKGSDSDSRKWVFQNNRGEIRIGVARNLAMSFPEPASLTIQMPRYRDTTFQLTETVTNLDTIQLTLEKIWCNIEDNCGEFTDARDGNVYSWAKYGGVKWMTQNLKYDAGFGSYCFDDLEEMCESKGRLYRWYTAMNGADTASFEGLRPQGVCPEGWFLPVRSDWKILLQTIAEELGVTLENEWFHSEVFYQLRTNKGWFLTNGGADEFSFHANSSGFKSVDGEFYNEFADAYYWLSDRSLANYAGWVSYSGGGIRTMNEYFALSIRCVQGDNDVIESSSSAEVSSSSQDWCAVEGNCGQFKDERDEKEYRWTKIGEQVWMAENLNFDLGKDSYCWEDLEANCDVFGRLYQWKNVRVDNAEGAGVCPLGWHVPSMDEWRGLIQTIKETMGTATEFDTFFSAPQGGTWLKSKSVWASDSSIYGFNGGVGTDLFGFNALPHGYGGSYESESEVGVEAWFWSTSLDQDLKPRIWGMVSESFYDSNVLVNGSFDDTLYSVRCLQDTE